MPNLLDSDVEVLLRSGHVWFPLLLDPSVSAEIEANGRNDLLICDGGRFFVRTLSLQSIVESGERLFPRFLGELRRESLRGIPDVLTGTGSDVSERLKTILFSVMPHFIRRRKSFDRRRLSPDEILAVVGQRIGPRRGTTEDATHQRDPAAVRRVLADLETRSPADSPLPEGRMPARAVGRWLSTALRIRILDEERRRLTRLLEALEEPGGSPVGREAILFEVARRGALEIDGFGFQKTGPGDDWLVYKRTGEYVLADWYGRLYLFPDCRVAVSTSGAVRPFVVETYKHPFLEAHDSGQEICLKRTGAWRAFSGTAVVEALEEGLAALLHGYSSRRRNGYHSLEGILRPVPAPVPVDDEPRGTGDDPVVRRRHILEVDFSDYRIPADHPRITSGEVRVTNNLLP